MNKIRWPAPAMLDSAFEEKMVKDLAKYRLEYIREKDIEAKQAIRSTVLLMFADYPKDKLPSELNYFMSELMGYR